MSELTQRVKAKYPQYANVPDADLEKRVLQKYPQYKKYASKTVGGFFENVGKSAVSAVTDIAGAAANVLNPDLEKNTLVNLGKLGVDTAKLVAGDPSELNRASQVLNFYKQRYGGVKNIGETFYNDPVGLILDASVVLGGAGAAVKGVGTAGKISGLTKAGTALTKAGAAIDPFVQTGKLAKIGVAKAGSRLPNRLVEASENLATRGLGNPVAQSKASKKAGRSVASFIDEYNLYDRSPEAAAQVRKNILNQYDELALRSGKQVSMGQIIKAFDDEIARLQQGVNGVISEADQSKIGELVKRKEMLLEASGATYHRPMKAPQKLVLQSDGTLKMQNQPIDPQLTDEFISSVPINVGTDTLTRFRRNVIDPDVPVSQFALDAKGSGSAQGVKRSRDIVKSAIDSSDKRLAKLGKDYGMAKDVEKIYEQAQARGNNRQLFNFTKLGGAGVGGVLGGLPGAITGYIAESIVNDPRSTALQSRSLRATAKTLGSEKARRTLDATGKVFSVGYSSGKSLRPFFQVAPKTERQKYATKTPIQREKSPSKTLPTIVPSPATPDPKKVKPLEYKPPKSVFTNKSAFGSTKKVQRGSFY